MSWHPVAAIAAVSLGLTGTAASAAPDDPRVDPTAEVLTADHDRHERMTVPVTIRGQGPFPFLIDTGAQATVLSLDLADRLQLNDRKTATLVGMASRQQVETTPVDEFTLGSRSFYVRQAPLVAGENIGGGADGILGLDALQDQRVVLDFKKGEIAVADHAEAGSSRGYEIVVKARERLGQLIITKARLDGVTVDVIIDTGAQGSVGNLALLNRLRRAREIGETEMTDINGFTLAGALRLGRELQIGDANIRNLPILFADTSTFGSLGLSSRPALILGMSELKLFQRVAIDFRKRRVLFDLPADIAYGNRPPVTRSPS